MRSLFVDSVWAPYAVGQELENIWLVVGALYHLGTATINQVMVDTGLDHSAAYRALTMASRQMKGDATRRQLVRRLRKGGGHHIHSLTRHGLKIARRECSAPTRLTELQYQAMRWVTTKGHHPFDLIKWLRTKPADADWLGVKLPRLSTIRFVFRKLLAAHFIEEDRERRRIVVTFSGKVRMMAKEAADERRKAKPSRKRSSKRKRKRKGPV